MRQVTECPSVSMGSKVALQKGLRLGRWMLVRQAYGIGRTAWLCRCTCGIERILKAYNLAGKRTQSCGQCKHLPPL